MNDKSAYIPKIIENLNPITEQFGPASEDSGQMQIPTTIEEVPSLVYDLLNQEKDTPTLQGKIRLVDFIQTHTKQITSEWEEFAQTLVPIGNHVTPLTLRDHIQEILAFIIADIKSPQTKLEQIQKSQGEKEKESKPTAAETHAALRLAAGFNIDQMVSEYRALRASVIKLWSKANSQMDEEDILDMIRFNESIDQELEESVSHYTKKVGYSKDLFIGVLSHDLRSPLNVISMSAHLMLNIGANNKQSPLNEKQAMLATQISESTARITNIVNDLLDITQLRFGYGLPVTRAFMDMEFLSKQLIDEMRAAHPTRMITLELSGDLKGEWDKARIGQVFSNLIGNAIQYGFKDSAINVAIKGTQEEVILSVHNTGLPIIPEKIGTIFDSLTRAVIDDGKHPGAVNLGLGLYITKEIVVSHGGRIDVISSTKEGTTFTAHFPRSV